MVSTQIWPASFVSILRGNTLTFRNTNEPGWLMKCESNVSAMEQVSVEVNNDLDAKQKAPLSGLRILLVDDSPDNQMLFHRVLTSAGASVSIAENGEAAVARASSEDFDAIVMDIRMPVMDGYQATRQIRANKYEGPIIALTAHANPGEEERCRAAGCSHFYLKPIDKRSLINAVGRAAIPGF